MPAVITKTLHLLIALGHGLIISLLVSRITQLRAMLVSAANRGLLWRRATPKF